jgi:dGTPase
VLDASVKYPWAKRDGTTKFGVYAEDADAFTWVRADAPHVEARSLEAQVMDWADDIAYSVHDLEDGIHARHIDLAMLEDAGERDALLALTEEYYPGCERDELVQALDGLRRTPWWVRDYTATHESLVALKKMTSELIARFCAAAYDSTRAAYSGALHRYDADLVVPTRARAECAVLKSVAARYVMHRAGVAEKQAGQRDVVHDLVSALSASAPDTLDPWLRSGWDVAADDAARLRIIGDQVASLTDTSAIALHETSQ